MFHMEDRKYCGQHKQNDAPLWAKPSEAFLACGGALAQAAAKEGYHAIRPGNTGDGTYLRHG